MPNEEGHNPAPRVGVLIPTYNRAGTLGDALRSVLEQTWTDFEVLVVDDGSTDRTEDVVRSFNDPRVRYVRLSKQHGAGGARNAGLTMMRNEWIAFQDSDDTWMPDKLEKQMALAAAMQPAPDVVYCRCLRRMSGQARIFPPRSVKETSGRLFDRMLTGNLISTQTALVRRTCFERWGLFDESMPPLEDWEYFLRLSRHVVIGMVDEVLVDAPFSTDSVSLMHERYARGFIRLLELYAADYASRPALLARHHGTIADRLYWAGLREEGRRHYAQAFRLNPRHAGHAMGWLLSWCPPLYRMASRQRRSAQARRSASS